MLMRLSLGVTLLAAFAAAGCKSPYHSDQLAGTGAVVGGLAGAAISKNPLAGAATGALIGGVSGAIVGDAMDEADARNQALFQARLGRQFTGTVTHQDVIQMSQAQLGDQVIVTHIRKHGVTQPPSAADLIALKQAGVSDQVLAAMQQSPPVSGPPVVYGAPPPVVVHEYWGPRPRYYHDPWCGPHYHHGPRVGWGVSVWR
jgi:hypothetical protein